MYIENRYSTNYGLMESGVNRDGQDVYINSLFTWVRITHVLCSHRSILTNVTLTSFRSSPTPTMGSIASKTCG